MLADLSGRILPLDLFLITGKGDSMDNLAFRQ